MTKTPFVQTFEHEFIYVCVRRLDDFGKNYVLDKVWFVNIKHSLLS